MANPRSIRLAGSGTATQQYELAPGLVQYVQAVYVEIDNTAGGDAQPTLTLSEQSGVVIAKKRQGEAITGGTSGSATWALRLADEGGGGGGAPLTVTDSATTVTNVVILNEDGTWFVVQDLGGGQARVEPGTKLVGFDKTNAGTDLNVTAAGQFLATVATLARLAVASGEVDFSVQKSGAIGVVEGVLNHATDVFRVKDASGAFAFQVLGSSNTTVNLRNGNTFVVNDHLGAPIVTYTG